MKLRTHSRTATMLVIATVGLLVGFAAGQAAAGADIARARAQSPGTIEAMATVTRQAELDELSGLRTQVAESAATCLPAGSDAAELAGTPAPPVPAGQEVPYGEDWTVVVKDLVLMPTFGSATAQGIYARVAITATNNTTGPLRFPYDDLTLRDAQDRAYLPALEAKTQLEANYFAQFSPSLPTDGFVIFDIAADAKGPFILESTADPAFRVAIEIEVRG